MVEQLNVEQRGGLLDAGGYRTVVVARLSCARRVVVYDDDTGGEQFQGPFDHEPLIHDRFADTSLADPAAVDDTVRGGEIYCPALFVAQVSEYGGEDAANVVARFDGPDRIGFG